MVLVGILAAMGHSIGRAEQPQLTYNPSADYKQVGRIYYTRAEKVEAPTTSLAGEPKYVSSKPVHFEAKLGPADAVYTFVMDESKGMGTGYDVLYLDANGDHDLSDEKPVQGTARMSGTSPRGDFPETEVLVDYGEQRLPWRFRPRYYTHSSIKRDDAGDVVEHKRNLLLLLTSVGCFEGTVAIAGKELKMAVVDADSDACFGSCYQVRTSSPYPGLQYAEDRLFATGDRLLIDFNGDGQFDLKPSGTPEAFPYGKYLFVNTGWYEVGVAPSGRSLRMDPATMPLGSLGREGGGASWLTLLSKEAGAIFVAPKGEPASAPVGTYELYSCGLTFKDTAGASWQAIGAGTTHGDEIVIEDAKLTSVKLGPPLRAVVEPSSSAGSLREVKPGASLRIGLVVKGEHEEVYSSAAITRDGQRLPGPTFEISDEDGKVAATGRFRYRGGGSHSYSWRVPKEIYNGAYQILVTLNAGPMKVTQTPAGFRLVGAKSEFSIYDVF